MALAALPANRERLLFNLTDEDSELRVLRFEAREAMSRPYEVTLDLVSTNHELDLAGQLGRSGRLEIIGPLTSRYYHGIIAELEQIAVGRRFSTYRALLVPAIWLLGHRSNCRIFQQQDVQSIAVTLLDELGLGSDERRFSLSENHPERVYCVQYRETDLNFLQRLFESEGIYYFFEQTADGAVMVMGDTPGTHPAIPEQVEIPYHEPRFGQIADEVYVHEIRLRHAIRSGKVTLRSWNFEKPSLNLEGDNAGQEDVELEAYDYPFDFDLVAHGDARAKMRLEGRRTATHVLSGSSPHNAFIAGHYLTLTEHPRDSFNTSYLITACRQQGEQPQVYEEEAGGGSSFISRLECIPLEVPYRPPLITPKPAVKGSQTAIVVGPSGEEIYTDEHGRIKVQFHWDREGQWDDNSSCWIRVGQSWAGRQWGSLVLPRIGQEVIVDFLEGDPDRPIVTGCVYHATNKPPYPLPAEKTKTTVKSDSSKGGGGFNEVRFEDKKGEEQVFIHAEKDLDLRIKNDRIEWVGHNQHLIVTQDKVERIDNERHETVAADHLEEIGKDRHLKVAGKQALETGGSHSLTVKGDVIEAFKANHSEQTTGDYFLKAGGIVIEATSGITLKCGSGSVVINSSGVTIKGGTITLDSNSIKLASGPGASPSSGSAGSAVTPSGPEDPLEADIADPGKAVSLKEQQAARREQFNFVPFIPPNAEQAADEEEEERTWIEIELVDEADQPVPGERYEITTPDGRVVRGTLDQNGFARVDGIQPGECRITFPRLDQEAWERA
jgi:type VI secretion system secreted protein VgrG